METKNKDSLTLRLNLFGEETSVGIVFNRTKNEKAIKNIYNRIAGAHIKFIREKVDQTKLETKK